MRFDQFTFPGSHSAGSGFDGPPRLCTGIDANECIFRNQDRSITEQLGLGIRYLSLDVCSLPEDCDASSYGDLGASRLVSCIGSETDMSFNGFAYGGSLVKILNQVDDWMRSNSGEVIGIHFTRNIPVGDRAPVFSSLVPLLEMMWGEGTANSSSRNAATEMSTYYSSNSNTWPTLRMAVETNQRIFIFVDNELSANDDSRPWINPTPFSTLAPQGLSFGENCRQSGIFEHASRCNVTIARDEDLVIAIGYTLVICINEGQASCNEILRNSTEVCYGLRQEGNRTINIVLVDYPNSGMDSNSVFAVVSDFNRRNVLQYISDPASTLDGGTATTPEDIMMTSTSAAVSSAPDTSNGVTVSLFSTALVSFLVLGSHIMSSFVLC